MIGIIDFSAGNIASVQNTLERLNAKFFVSNNAEELAKADKIIFPGVGHAKAAIENLRTNNLINFLQNYTNPILGICLGMQLLFEKSEEGNVECIGVIKGNVKKFSFPKEKKVIVPHMGWNSVKWNNSALNKNVSQDSDFYFVHSYYCEPLNKKEIAGITEYADKTFCSAIQKDNFYGVQFHPEKSGEIGQKIIENFINLK